MELYPVAIVHGLDDALALLAEAETNGNGVTLLSAPGAALYAGCGWWKAVVDAARGEHPKVPCIAILDCADGTGQAFAAMRVGLSRVVLWPEAPSRGAVVAIACSLGGFVLAKPPLVTPLPHIVKPGQQCNLDPMGNMRRPLPARRRVHAGNGDKWPAPG